VTPANAHLAAPAVDRGLTLCSSDGDFARFPGLRWENPLAWLPPPRGGSREKARHWPMALWGRHRTAACPYGQLSRTA